MNKKVKKSILWTVVLLIWIALMNLVQFWVDMFYSTDVATSQFDDNSPAYEMIHIHCTINSIVWVVGIVGIVYFMYRILKVLVTKTTTVIPK